ncbi:cystathionine beta-lyase [Novosphingobium album (ex Hu et al. 2023)]|uniref:Cystathionine beta-lyase n=1 Tax=Novosphingobium album (ex Hu et al. 2023) TaxID=2930093 RepID=A0ABT0B220_9SPHN|nr:cystathionine beta-lyase [Novosphingobium album (ex Hu et al. 2023)]MCJ2178966.1 cystathionine beta-lyase [Novosphingobium album (ex Hu et al. 2023)]
MSDTSNLENAAAGTKVVGAGRRKEWTGAVVNPPVWRASTHLYENTAALAEGPRKNEDGRFFYGRRGAPTQWALSEALTQLEPGAAGTVLYPSGVAAIAGVLLTVLRPGDVLMISDNAYDPSRTMGKGLLHDFGIEPRFFDPLDLSAYEAAFCERTRAVLLEAPGSLSMEVCALPELARIASAQGAVSIFDNTWASPLGFQALEKGIDITLMALTKHVGGHSDLMMGSASAGPELYAKLRTRAQQLGTVVSPDDASLALRGLRTLHLRLKQETETALAIAQWLSHRPEVAQVFCPMLPGAPGHELWKRDFTGGCGLFSFVFRGGSAAARNRFVDALTLFGIGFSWGGYESLALPIDPAVYRSCMAWPPAPALAADRYGVRLSIGLEDPADLIADIEQALSTWSAE